VGGEKGNRPGRLSFCEVVEDTRELNKDGFEGVYDRTGCIVVINLVPHC
jgi:hypothetical protein